MAQSRTEGAPVSDSGIPNILYTHGHATHDLVVPRRPWQRYLAEFLGTFAIVFIGCGSVIGSSLKDGAMPPVGITLAFGFIVAAMIYALGPISALSHVLSSRSLSGKGFRSKAGASRQRPCATCKNP